MASYITTAYLQGKLGTDFYADTVAVAGIDVTQMIADATDVIRGALKNSGYQDYDVSDGGATRYRYIVSNRFEQGRATEDLWDTARLPPGNYILRGWAADISGNVTQRDVPVALGAPSEER